MRRQNKKERIRILKNAIAYYRRHIKEMKETQKTIGSKIGHNIQMMEIHKQELKELNK